jgi:hypothetical protein
MSRMAALTVVSLAMSSNVADLRAGVGLTVVVAGPDFYCLFDASCAVSATTTSSTFTIPGMAGQGVLHTRTFAASAGSPAEGSYGYEYQIDLSGVTGTTGLNCIDAMRIKVGAPLATLDYDGDGTVGDQVYLAGPIGGNNIVSIATREGSYVTFSFIGNVVCPGPPVGDTTVVFGVVASGPPMSVLAELQPFVGGSILTGARAPNLIPTASFKLTLLYDTIATLPPGGIIAPVPQAGEGRRRAMLNAVNTALRHLENGNALPAVQSLTRLLSLTDGDADDWVQDDPDTRVNEQTNLLQIIQEIIEMLVEDGRSDRAAAP